MAKQDNKDYTSMQADALMQEIADMKRELLNLRFQKISGELTNTARFREVRKNIARAYTSYNAQLKGAA